MRIRQTRVFLGLVSTLFCTIAFSSTGTDQVGGPTWFEVAGGSESVIQEPVLLAAAAVKIYVCRVKDDGFMTMLMKEDMALKKIEEDPGDWLLGKCEDVVSPSS